MSEVVIDLSPPPPPPEAAAQQSVHEDQDQEEQLVYDNAIRLSTSPPREASSTPSGGVACPPSPSSASSPSQEKRRERDQYYYLYCRDDGDHHHHHSTKGEPNEPSLQTACLLLHDPDGRGCLRPDSFAVETDCSLLKMQLARLTNEVSTSPTAVRLTVSSSSEARLADSVQPSSHEPHVPLPTRQLSALPPSQELRDSFIHLEKLWDGLRRSTEKNGGDEASSQPRSPSYDTDLTELLPRSEKENVSPSPLESRDACYSLSSQALLASHKGPRPAERSASASQRSQRSRSPRATTTPNYTPRVQRRVGALKDANSLNATTILTGTTAVKSDKTAKSADVLRPTRTRNDRPKHVRLSCAFCGVIEDVVLRDATRLVIHFCPFCGMKV